MVGEAVPGWAVQGEAKPSVDSGNCWWPHGRTDTAKILAEQLFSLQSEGMLHFKFLDLIKVYSASSRIYTGKELFFSNNLVVSHF